MMKSGAPPDKVGVLYRLFVVSRADMISKGYHSLVPGLISMFLETVWVPLKLLNYSKNTPNSSSTLMVSENIYLFVRFLIVCVAVCGLEIQF